VEIAKSNVQQAEARLQGTNAQLQFTELRAPFAGTVTEQLQYPGDMAQPTNPIFTVADLSLVNARAQVPEASAGAVKQGQLCTFRSIDKEDAQIAGRITVVNRAVDPQRRTVEVWCEIVRPPVWVRAGTFGTVSIRTGEVHSAVMVPKASLQLEEGSDQGTVFVVDPKHIAHKREVTAGVTNGGNVQIASGLKAGETIVVEGAYGLPDNAQVILKGERKTEKKEEKE
jgi:RND family efflux transporter MFP subunit